MSRYRLTIDQTTYDPAEADCPLALKSLTVAYNAGRRLLLRGRLDRPARLPDLFTPIRLQDDQNTVLFAGRITGSNERRDAEGQQFTLTAQGPLGLAGMVTAVDDLGIAKLEYRGESTSDVIADLMVRHQDCLAQLSAAGDPDEQPCCDLNDLEALHDAPVQVVLENYPLDQALLLILEDQHAGIVVDPETLVWHFHRFDQLPQRQLRLNAAGGEKLLSVQVDNDLLGRCSAVKLFGPRTVQIAAAEQEVQPAWDSALESSWSWPHRHYSSGSAEADEYCWVYRRYSYAGIDDLLEDQPVQLLQQVTLSGGYTTLVPVETMPLDTANKYVVARYPLVESPAQYRVNGDTVEIPGRARAASRVVLRYRRLAGVAACSCRYPQSGFDGPVAKLFNFQRQRSVYVSDASEANETNARRLWSNGSLPAYRCRLTVRGVAPRQFSNLDCKLRFADGELAGGPLPALPLMRLDHDFERSVSRLCLAHWLDR